MRQSGMVLLMTTTPQLISSPQAAVILCVSVRTVHRMVAAGTLTPALTAPGGPHGAYLFYADEIERAKAEVAA